MTEQRILTADNNYSALDNCFSESGAKKIMLVCDSAMPFLKISRYFDTLEERLNIGVLKFSDFKPNPDYESVAEGVRIFNDSGCDLIVAVGGGSAIDVAKCIKLYSNMDSSENYLKQKIVPNNIPFIAVPTTAGTGSEATRYAVIYYNGEKQSVSDYSCIPSTVLIDSSVLNTLPEYQKKSTMLDALCHSIESYWSVNSNDESKKFSREALKMILENMEAYLRNEETANRNMQKAAFWAGKAINITQTTAGHAMCYKLTSLYGIAHGHAAALCLSKLFGYMADNTDKCVDSRGRKYLESVFCEIAEIMDKSNAYEASEKLDELLKTLKMSVPSASEEEIAVLKKSVNPVRLKNNPVELDENAIEKIYRMILK